MPKDNASDLIRTLDTLASLVDTGGDEGLAEAVEALAGVVSADCHALLRIFPDRGRVDVLACSGSDCGSSGGDLRLELPGFIDAVLKGAGDGTASIDSSLAGYMAPCGEGLNAFLVSKPEPESLSGDALLVSLAARLEPGPFSDQEIQVFDAAARYIQLMVRYWYLTGVLRVHTHAEHDPVTGLPLYSAFHDAIEREISRARRKVSAHLSIGLIEIPGMDTGPPGGHVEGDQAPIKEIAGFLTEHFRDFDMVARYGARGFSVLLPDLSGDDSLKVTDRVMGELAEFLTDVVPSVSEAVRAGVASYPGDATNAERLIEKAEAALQKAREEGSRSAVRWEG